MVSEEKGGAVAADDHRHADHDHDGELRGHRHDDAASHDHHDHGGAGHVHAPASFGKAFAIGITLNTALVVAEAVYGYLGNSTALMADAGHNLSDGFGLLVAWAASIASKRAPSGRFTYGLRGYSILAALANAVFLLVATGAIGVGVDSALPGSGAGRWRHRHGGGRDRDLRQRSNRLVVRKRPQGGYQHPGRLPAYGGRRRRVGRRRGLGGAHHVDRMAMAGSGQ